MIQSLEKLSLDYKLKLQEVLDGFISDVDNVVREGMVARAEWVIKDIERKAEIMHYANSDMQHVKIKSYEKPERKTKKATRKVVDFMSSPLQNLQYQLKKIAPMQAEGEGYLHDHFFVGGIKARKKELVGLEEAKKKMDAKANLLYGKTWDRLMNTESIKEIEDYKLAVYDFMNPKEPVLLPITVGQGMYIYAVNKMTDGIVKLRNMGISDIHVEAFKNKIPPKMIELADWISDVLFKESGERYNETHKRKYGIEMSMHENYVPLVIAESEHAKDIDLNSEYNKRLLSSIAGSIIRRVFNKNRIDLNVDLMDLAKSHIKEMEHWNAYTELVSDANFLLSNNRFRNKMESNRKGSHQTLKDAFAVGYGAYMPKTTKLDEAFLMAAKGATSAQISYRLMTAAKQMLAFPAFLEEASPKFYGYFIKNGIHQIDNFKFMMEHDPIFRERWLSKIAGNEKLKTDDIKLAKWYEDFNEKFLKKGMIPNAFVDAVVCAWGGKSMFDYKFDRYKSMGFDEATAHEKALTDATIAYNSLQQSAEDLFLSTVQKDRTFLNVGISIFQNANIGYQRKLASSVREFSNYVKYKDLTFEIKKKKYARAGLTEEQSEKAAQEDIKQLKYKIFARMFLHGVFLQLFWNSFGRNFIFGDDDEEKKKEAKQLLYVAPTGMMRGLPFGVTLEQAMQAYFDDRPMRYALENMYGFPFISEGMRTYKDIESAVKQEDIGKGAYALFNFAGQFTGVKPDTFTHAFVGLSDLVTGGYANWNDIRRDFLLFMNAPKSQIKELELQIRKGEDLGQYIERYCRFKKMVYAGKRDAVKDKGEAIDEWKKKKQ